MRPLQLHNSGGLRYLRGTGQCPPLPQVVWEAELQEGKKVWGKEVVPGPCLGNQMAAGTMAEARSPT